MNNSTTSNPMTFGKEIEIIRQRFFIDYTSNSKFYSEEYTMMCKTVNEKGIDNIFIKSPKLLPNLKIYDYDGAELALVINKLTKALITNLIKHTETGKTKDELEKLLKDMVEQKIFLLWIKLPSAKRFQRNECRVITLEYDAVKEDVSTNEQVLEFHSSPHEVFYVVKQPQDYEFDKEEIEIYEEDGTKLKDQRKKWDKKPRKGDAFYFNENRDSISIRISPNVTDQIKFTYSFKPTESVTYFPMFTLLILSAASILLFVSSQHFVNICSQPKNCTELLTTIKTAHIEIAIGIILGALALPNLIKNHYIRHSLTKYFIFPIVVAIASVFL